MTDDNKSNEALCSWEEWLEKLAEKEAYYDDRWDFSDRICDAVDKGYISRTLKLLESEPEKIEWWMAERCLIGHMRHAIVAQYEKLLSLFPEGEHSGSCDLFLQWSCPRYWKADPLKISVCGTLVSLAVAFDRPDILKLLLEKGHDVNAASFSSHSTMLRSDCMILDHYHSNEEEYMPCLACGINLRVVDREKTPAQIFFEGGEQTLVLKDAVSPLALAVLMGHADCARILLEHGAWMEKTSSVSWAMNLSWRECDETYRAAREIVSRWGGPVDHRPVLSAMTDCSVEQFHSVLSTYSFERKEYVAWIRHALDTKVLVEDLDTCELRAAIPHPWREQCSKLLEVGKFCPEAFEDAKAVAAILQCGGMEDFSLEPLLPLIEGRTLDLSCCSPGVLLKKRLEELSQHCNLIADRWRCSCWNASVGQLQVILRYVRFYSGERTDRISVLTKSLMNTKNRKLICKALEQGVIQEPVKDLLQWLHEVNLSAFCQEVLLIAKRDEREAWVDPDSWENALFDEISLQVDGRQVRCYGLNAACLSGDAELVRRHMLHSLRLAETWWYEWKRLELQSYGKFYCSPLCAAALGGQNEIVRILIDEFTCPVDEWKQGIYSTWGVMVNGADVTVLLDAPAAAAIGGHWDTVKLLLEKGATPHWDNLQIRELWQLLRGTDLTEEVRTHLGEWALTVNT